MVLFVDQSADLVMRLSRCPVAWIGSIKVGAVWLATEAVPEPAPGEQHQHRCGGQRDREQHLAVSVGMHGQAHRLTQPHAVGGVQRDVDGNPLGEIHFDRYAQRQISGRQLDLARGR